MKPASTVHSVTHILLCFLFALSHLKFGKASFCPFELDSNYTGYLENGKCLTLVHKYFTKDEAVLTPYLANMMCEKLFVDGFLHAFKMVPPSSSMWSYTDFYTGQRFNARVNLMKISEWKLPGYFGRSNLLNGIRVTSVNISHEGNTSITDINFAYFSGAVETVRVRRFRGTNYLDRFPVLIEPTSFLHLVTTNVKHPLCFFVPTDRPNTHIIDPLLINIIFDCHMPGIVDHFICSSKPFDWCTVKEVDKTGTEKKCVCAVGKKNVRCSNTTCAKGQSFRTTLGKSCISPELIEIDEKAQDGIHQMWIYIYVVIGLSITLILFLIVLFSRRIRNKKKVEKKDKEVKEKEVKVGTTGMQVDLSEMKSKTSTSNKSKINSKSNKPSESPNDAR